MFASKETPDAFRKAVQIVHSKPKQPLSLLQRKLGNAWAKHAIENNPDENGWWVLSIRDLAADVGFDSNNRQYLKEAAEALMRIVFEWDVMSPTNKRPWKASVMFPEVEIHADRIRYQISSQLRELIVKPEIYALIDMNVVRRFRRAPSLAIWEFCSRYEKIGQTAEAEWQKFRDMILGETAEAVTYQEYKYFKAKVLKPAIAEINVESNLKIDLVEAKMGKRVTSLRFLIEKKAVAEELVDDGRAIELIGELVRLGVMQSEARRIVKDHPPDAVKAALEYTKRRMADKRSDKLDNPAAYFRHALQHRYAAPAEEAQQHHQQEKTVSPKIDLREAYLQEQLVNIEGYFKELDSEDQSALIERYNEQTIGPLKLTKKTSKVAEAGFRRWLVKDVWGEPTSEDLVDFAQRILASQQ
ncbi:MAG TPA: replication initiation protein [Burkholderiaceae bacterium]|nr:replication initiation protein [Burkholderiaceae bacterium]